MSYPSTVKPFPTLKGIFTVPKVTHRRDFLRENKLSLRDLERETAEKLAAKEPKRPKWLPAETTQRRSSSQIRSGEQSHAPSLRSASRTRSIDQIAAPLQPTLRSFGNKNHDTQSVESLHRHDAEAQLSPKSSKSSLSKAASIRAMQKSTTELAQPMHAKPSQAKLRQEGGYTPSLHEDTHNGSECCHNCGSHISLTSSKTSMRDTAMQTDEIQDEHFLAKALLKCNSRADTRSIVPRCEAFDNDANRKISPRNGLVGADYEQDDYNALNDMQEQDMPQSGRSRYAKHYNETAANNHDNDADERSLRKRFGDLELDDVPKDLREKQQQHEQHQQYQHDDEVSLSARSRNTILSNMSNKSKVRLPRYLEREKREKAEQVLRERDIDPDCPMNHVRLTEQERLDALAGVKKKYETLINELNRLPMTTQTLRVKNRKADIERELGIVEDDMRIFSKPKVYVKRA